MARPWQPRLFVFQGLHDKLQVRQRGQLCGLTPDAVVGALLRVWIEFQQRADEAGRLEGKWPGWVDLIVGQSGFADAMVKVGWLRVDGSDLVVPDFDDCISKKAVKRTENAHRMANARDARPAQPATTPAGSPHINTLPHTSAHKVADAPVVTPKRRAAAKKKQDAVTDDRFWTFWNAWPKKTKWGLAQVYEVWASLSLTDDTVGAIVASVEKWKLSTSWTKDNGQFIPTPKRWLEERRWEADPGGPVQPGPRIQPRPGAGRSNRDLSADAGPPPAAVDPPPPNGSLF
jgi:hypothetical protein